MTLPPALPEAQPHPTARPPWLAALRRDLGEMAHELIEYRELLLSMTRRDLLLRYKQTLMGRKKSWRSSSG